MRDRRDPSLVGRCRPRRRRRRPKRTRTGPRPPGSDRRWRCRRSRPARRGPGKGGVVDADDDLGGRPLRPIRARAHGGAGHGHQSVDGIGLERLAEPVAAGLLEHLGLEVGDAGTDLGHGRGRRPHTHGGGAIRRRSRSARGARRGWPAWRACSSRPACLRRAASSRRPFNDSRSARPSRSASASGDSLGRVGDGRGLGPRQPTVAQRVGRGRQLLHPGRRSAASTRPQPRKCRTRTPASGPPIDGPDAARPASRPPVRPGASSPRPAAARPWHSRFTNDRACEASTSSGSSPRARASVARSTSATAVARSNMVPIVVHLFGVDRPFQPFPCDIRHFHLAVADDQACRGNRGAGRATTVCHDLPMSDEPPSAPPEPAAAPSRRPDLESPHLGAGQPRRAVELPFAQGAVASLVCGIIGFGCVGFVLGPVAIYLGHQARVRIRASSGQLRGSTMALVGMWLGGAAFVATLAVIVMLVVGAVEWRRPAALTCRRTEPPRSWPPAAGYGRRMPDDGYISPDDPRRRCAGVARAPPRLRQRAQPARGRPRPRPRRTAASGHLVLQLPGRRRAPRHRRAQDARSRPRRAEVHAHRRGSRVAAWGGPWSTICSRWPPRASVA